MTTRFRSIDWHPWTRIGLCWWSGSRPSVWCVVGCAWQGLLVTPDVATELGIGCGRASDVFRLDNGLYAVSRTWSVGVRRRGWASWCVRGARRPGRRVSRWWIVVPWV